jgi:hypothetical protein
MRFAFKPKDDITAIELATILLKVGGVPMTLNVGEDKLTDAEWIAVSRHFNVLPEAKP